MKSIEEIQTYLKSLKRELHEDLRNEKEERGSIAEWEDPDGYQCSDITRAKIEILDWILKDPIVKTGDNTHDQKT